MLPPQLPLVAFPLLEATSRPLDSLLIPELVSAVSAVVLLVQLVWTSVFPKPCDRVPTHQRRVLIFKALRLFACLSLLLVSVKQRSFSATFTYTAALAAASVLAHHRLEDNVVGHLDVVLAVALAVYLYRDIVPLTTYDGVPLDASEGYILWTKLALLFVGGMFVPLCRPRVYIPVDPKNPMPNPEQTVSWISVIFCLFLDPLVLLGYRLRHLSLDQLPPLADDDQAGYLKARIFPYLSNKRHVVLGLLWAFAYDYLVVALCMAVMGVANFAAPLGINPPSYLEHPDDEQTVKPWVWIIFIFIGPTLRSTALQWSNFVSGLISVRLEAVITELVFEHALRMRLKAEVDGQDSTKANLLGRITNLVTVDLANITGGVHFMILLVLIPVETTLSIIFLYELFGWSAFVGLAVMVALWPVPGFVAKRIKDVQEVLLTNTDARVQAVTETMTVLRMVKLLGWDGQMSERIAEKRNKELAGIWKIQMLNLVDSNIQYLIPLSVTASVFATHVRTCSPQRQSPEPHQTLLMKEDLSASKVFSSLVIFQTLRNQLGWTFRFINLSVTAKVSLDRLNTFLSTTELLDRFTTDESKPFVVAPHDENAIGFRDATFTWTSEAVDGTITPSRRAFRLRVDGELRFKTGVLNIIVGPTGSGKTSLLMALLGEMHFIPSSPSSWYNLPRANGVSYAAQESWVMNETIKKNILFGSEYEEERYKKVIYQCALERDLELLDAGDATEVGEKGLTLSGGQKARVTLARAIYSKSEIILLDDILAALDVHTARWVVDKCLRGDLVKSRTVILVTHSAMVTPIASYVVSMNINGTTHSHGPIADALATDKVLAEELVQEPETVDDKKETVDGASPSEKLIVNEEMEEGHVSLASLMLYLRGLGGRHPFLFLALCVLGLSASQLFFASQAYWLGQWAEQYETHVPSEVNVAHYMGFYMLLIFGTMTTYIVAAIFYRGSVFRASTVINRQLVDSILGTTFRWLDRTPSSRVITRCTVDIQTVDTTIPSSFWGLVEMTIGMIVEFSIVILYTPTFLLPGLLVGVLGGWCGQMYIITQLGVKREMSVAKAPVLGHFEASMAGLISIRAYGAQSATIQTSMARIDRYSRVARTFRRLNQWVALRVDALGATFTAVLAYYLVYYQNAANSDIGFVLKLAVSSSSMILWWVRLLNDCEVLANSLERLRDYIEIEQEPKATAAGVPPAYWPASGSLEVQKLSASYSADGPKVLQDISFNVKPGERVGIVGRTGSGKSSLTLSLLRAIVTNGNVLYDGLPISSLNLDALRSSMTIIPQVPELLTGTLRMNLDIFEEHDDETLNSALRAAGLFALQSEMDEGRLTLDSEISGGSASNLSVGQRQILALARAIVRGSKLLILDEATSAIDHKTDAIIQSSLRTELPKDTTLLIVAHRLQTILDADKILVLDAGRMVEFDTVLNLFDKKGSVFRSMCDEAKISRADIASV
uniref:Multidrug resistance-associated ABC transporter protein n=1 Tax=Mycena chlorophos TaxID=658473 RepID=A0ABQ0KXL5_MYCCL|nr:multidrug resistance-associated ABC transporter protein [Mycena chlorophos]